MEEGGQVDRESSIEYRRTVFEFSKQGIGQCYQVPLHCPRDGMGWDGMEYNGEWRWIYAV
jgi:hypothetical protein